MTHPEQRYNEIIVTTTPTIEGRAISRYAGIVNAVYVIGAGFVGGITAMFSSFAGSRNQDYGNQMDIATAEVLKELKLKALRTSDHVDAIVALKMDYTVTDSNSNLLMVSATGTAVETVPRH